MKKYSLLFLTILLFPLYAAAESVELSTTQTDSTWLFKSVLPTDGIPVDTALANASGMHGVAVDGDGKIWLQPFAATEEIVLAGGDGTPVPTRALYIYNADGTPADFSPLTVFEYADGTTDTIGHFFHSYGKEVAAWEGMSGRGLRADDDGNIIVSTGGVIYRISKDGKGMNKFPYLGADGLMDSPTAAAVDGEGNVYIAPVIPGANSLIKLPKDFSPDTEPEVLLAATPGFSRSFEVSADGNTIYWAGYSTGQINVYSRTDEFSPFDPAVYDSMPGLRSESVSFQPETGYIWISAGSSNDQPFYGYQRQTWYAFDPSNLKDPVESITWNVDAMENTIGVGTGRPRGLAFSADGKTAYVVQFNEGILAAQSFSGKVRATKATAKAWNFSDVLPTDGIPVDTALANASGMHGVAVDGDGKIWLQPFAATEEIVLAGGDGTPVPTRALYIYNADGTPADFSPLTVFEYADGTTDTIGHFFHSYGKEVAAWEGMSGRGLRADDDGNIIVSTGGVIYRISKDGKGMNKFPYLGADGLMDSPTAAAVDGEGNVYIAPVIPGANSLIKLPKDFSPDTEPEVLLAATPGFSRSFEVSADGNTIYWAGYSTGQINVYSRTDEFSPFDPAVYDSMPGLRSESVSFQPETGYIWISAGSVNDQPFNGYLQQTWYAFDPSDLTKPVESITWNVDAMENTIGVGAGRPRGLAFSADGKTAYVVQFNEGILAAQKFGSEMTTSIEPEVNEIPNSINLSQNYPNPFNPTTTIKFELQIGSDVTLEVFDVSGRKVATLVNTRLNAGQHFAVFDASTLSSGVYFYRLRAGNMMMTKSMTLIK